MSKELFKPKEILERNPGLKKIWDARAIGYMLMLCLVRGEQDRRTCRVNEQDVLALFKIASVKNFANKVAERG